MVYKMKLADISEIEIEGDVFRNRTLPFTKMHGNGNDFILIDELHHEHIPESRKSSYAIRFCQRNFGIGGDGVLFLICSSQADLGMRIFQPDGSEAEMCGNGIRCLAKYAYESGYIGSTFSVETLAGMISIEVREMDNCFWATIDMGTPRFDRPSIPAVGSGEFMKEELDGFQVSAVNTGVPHAVIFVDDLNLPISEIAPRIRHNMVFPEGANVNFVETGSSFKIRTFERGVEAETLSCGTGAVACATVARKLGLIENEVLVETRGGPLMVYFEGDRAFMEGPAATIYSGELSEEFSSSFCQEL
jgi:diaminopimelate epimerase